MTLVKTAELCIVTVGAVQMSGGGVATRSPARCVITKTRDLITSEVFVPQGATRTSDLFLSTLRL